MKIIIEEIVEWEKDDAEIEGDRCHGGSSESDILMQLAEETKAKKESKWTKGLPFVWESEVSFEFDAVTDVGKTFWTYLDDALSEYSAQYCAGDYLKPTEFEGKIVA